MKSDIWSRVRRFWKFPNLNPPVRADDIIPEEIAAIDMKSKRIMVNKRNLEERIGSDLIEPVLAHEVGHYKLCPYSLKNFVRLVGHADAVVKDIEQAKLVENLFADLLVNYHLFSNGMQDIATVYQRLSHRREPSSLWDFYLQTFAGMINKTPPKNSLSETQRADAKKLSDILRESTYKSKNWPESITEFAKSVKDYLDQTKQKTHDENASSGSSDSDNPSSEKTPQPTYKPAAKPIISKHDVKEFIPLDTKKASDSDKAKYFEKELKGLSKELGKDQYERTLEGLGIATKKQSQIWFYRDMANAFQVGLPIVYSTAGNLYKETPIKCDLDHIHEADFEYSLSQTPVIAPDFLYRWKMAQGNSCTQGHSNPDLLLVLDSSGSMPDPSENLSFAVLSATIAKETALEAGNRVAVINFSDSYLTQGFTNSSDKLDESLNKYFGGTTEIPGKEIEELIKKHSHPVHIVLITDTDIHNLDSQLTYLESAIKAGKSGGTIFLDSDRIGKTGKLESIGYEVINTRSFEDLPGLTLRKAGELYT